MCYTRNKMQLVFTLLLAVATAAVSAERTHHIKKRSDGCILPPYPKHGSYEVTGEPSAKPLDDLETAFLNVTCHQGYSVIGNNVVVCINGKWSIKMPECVPICYLPKQSNLKYRCLSPGAEVYRACNEYEPIGSTVKSQCQSGYYHMGALPLMRCVDGHWNNEAVICTKECGRIQDGETGLPWHADIYKKDKIKKMYTLLCSGTIISNTVIVTAAHCFWNYDKSKMSTFKYAAVVGQTQAEREQKLIVSEVKMPVRFQGAQTNFQEDIALVILTTPLEYSAHVQPACVDFDSSFEMRQLQPGSLGKVPVRSDLTDSNSTLQVMEVPYMSLTHCITITSPTFREYITSDKFCAGHQNGTVMCRGNSGAGLSFPEEERGFVRYSLRGVVSTAPNTKQNDNCLTDFIAFTQVSKHEHFIKEYFV